MATSPGMSLITTMPSMLRCQNVSTQIIIVSVDYEESKADISSMSPASEKRY